MKTLERQLHEYGEFQIELRDPISPDTVTSQPLQPDSIVWWRKPSIVVSLVTAVVILLLGLVPLLRSSPEQDVVDPARLPVPTTTPSTPAPSTAEPTEPEGAADDDQSGLVQSGVVEPLVFTEIEPPNGDLAVGLRDEGQNFARFVEIGSKAVYFDGAIHSMTESGQLWAFADGETWELVKDLTELSGPLINLIAADSDALVALARDQGVRRGGEECMAAGHQLYVHVMRVDGSWTSAQIPQPYTGESECRVLWVGEMVVGPHGIMITGEVTGPSWSGFEGHSVGWWSPNGVDWQPMDTTIPDQHGGIQGAIATKDGFIVITDGNEDTPRVTLTTQDGQSWQTVESSARHHDSLFQLNGEVLVYDPVTNMVRDLFTGEDRLPAEVFRGRGSWLGPDVHFGGLGIVGTPSCSSLPAGCGSSAGSVGEVETFVYSPDGVNFVEWKPTEFDYYTVGVGERMSEDDNGSLGLVGILGMTDDFVLLVHQREDNGETVQTLWVGRPSTS